MNTTAELQVLLAIIYYTVTGYSRSRSFKALPRGRSLSTASLEEPNAIAFWLKTRHITLRHLCLSKIVPSAPSCFIPSSLPIRILLLPPERSFQWGLFWEILRLRLLREPRRMSAMAEGSPLTLPSGDSGLSPRLALGAAGGGEERGDKGREAGR